MMVEEMSNTLNEKLNPEYPKGLEELAEVLDFLPEEMRLKIATAFLGVILAN